MHMVRSAGALAAGLTLIATAAACGGGDDDANDAPKPGGSSSNSASGDSAGGGSSAASPSPTQALSFDSVPGPSAVMKGFGGEDQPGLKVKIIDTAWAAQLGDRPAPAGQHFLVAYVIIKPSLDDRGTTGVGLSDLTVVFDGSTKDCTIGGVTLGGKHKCTGSAFFASIPVYPAEAPPATEGWASSPTWKTAYTDADLAPGAQMLGIVGFQIRDSAKLTGVSLCGDTTTHTPSNTTCVPLTVPERTS